MCAKIFKMKNRRNKIMNKERSTISHFMSIFHRINYRLLNIHKFTFPMRQFSLFLLIPFLFLVSSLSICAQSEVIYKQDSISIYLSITTPASPTTNAQIGNNIVLAGTNRLLERIQFAIHSLPTSIAKNDTFGIYIWSSCPAPNSDSFGGSCGDNGQKLISAIEIQRVTVPSEFSSIDVILPSPIDLSGETNNQIIFPSQAHNLQGIFLHLEVTPQRSDRKQMLM